MKNILLTGFLFLLILTVGCSDTDHIGDDYEVSYVDIQNNRNIYYKNQGVFDNLSVNMVIYNKDKILVRGCLFKNTTEVDHSKYLYFYINKLSYASDPSQMKSSGLFGPVDSLAFENIRKNLGNSEILSW
ncbi:hypothetical protein [Pedobacter caeni]|uniref:DUF4369 domain-containing protein n=1 Tax=Pedobacter caeni TaxID=288992 RepID=A0A1M4WWA4_9SPHI|nr:hypothetical protein [Pedobacter caeni]SHE85485.1 hypothetical protein SAMN04488522_1011408 [Pedobacter caeni]